MTITILGVVAGIAMYSFLGLKNSARDAAQSLVGSYAQARSGAMSNTLAYRLVYDSGVVRLETSLSCSDLTGWNVKDASLFTVPPDVTLTTAAPGGVVVCYTSRGVATDGSDVTLVDAKNHSFTLRSYMGGAVRMLNNA